MFQAFFSAIYPLNCLGCSVPLVRFENKFCVACYAGFKKVESGIDKPVYKDFDQVFWGKANVAFSWVVFEYVKGENLAELIHEFKYKGNREIGVEFARLMSQFVQDDLGFMDVDVITYVPMFKKKEKKRGYNQAQVLADAFSGFSKLNCLELIKRRVNTKTQTEKNVFERFENMDNKFEVVALPQKVKHILIVDDVVTTGATLCACVNLLKEKYNVKVSVMALAYRDL